MKISYNWLKQYLSFLPPADELAGLLTNCGLEVEGVERYESVRGGMKGLLVGEVVEKKSHPNADRLSVAKVNIGDSILRTIVCGAPNVAAGQKVVVALPGTILYPVSGEPFELKAAKIRSIPSEGMICAEDEVGLGTMHEGIMVLDHSAQVGKPAKEYFNVTDDHVFIIGLTPNRGDAASHIGVARDLCAAINVLSPGSCTMTVPSVASFSPGNHTFSVEVVIEDKKACPRYSGLTMTNVRTGESPAWLKQRLEAVGMKPVFNLVDIANFVMLECGQPLHIFDADEIAGKKVVVKKLPEGSEFITLDGHSRKLSSDDLMICDAEEGMCIAGVFGGKKSGVSAKTKNIFIESAFFDPSNIRRTARRHGLFTDASFRFERRTDPECTIWALQRAALLIKEIAGGEIASGVVDTYPEPFRKKNISFSYGYLDTISGIAFDRNKAKDILVSLGFEIKEESSASLNIGVPTWKTDVDRPADVAEEILRIYGYNRIPAGQSYRSAFQVTGGRDREGLRHAVADMLSALGFHEMVSNSLTRSSYTDLTGNTAQVRLAARAVAGFDVMRTTLLFNGLEAIAFNRNRQNDDLRLYEFGLCYETAGKPPAGTEYMLPGFTESERLALFICGKKNPESYRTVKANADFFQLKGWVNQVLNRTGITGWQIKDIESNSPVFDYGLHYLLNGKTAALFGKVRRNIQHEFDISTDVFYAEIDFSLLGSLYREDKIRSAEIPRFPSVRRDIAVVVDKNIRYSDLERAIRQSGGDPLKNILLFDRYEGAQVPQGKISYAIGLTFRDEQKTFTDEQINRLMEKITAALEKQVMAEIRK